MASPQVCRSLCHNFSSSGKDELARGASTKDNNIYTLTPTALHALNSALALALPSTNELFKQFIKTYLEKQN